MSKFLIIFTFSSLLLGDNDNIYELISSPRNISIGGIHASTDNISGMFDSPLFLNQNNNNIFLYNSIIDLDFYKKRILLSCV